MKIVLDDTVHEDIIVNENYPFISKIYLPNEEYHCIVDNMYNKWIKGYILNYSFAETFDDEHILNITLNWYNNNHEKPISLLYERMGIKLEMEKYFKSFHINKIVKIQGPVFSYIQKPKQIRRHQFKL